MRQYSKHILTISDQVQSYIDAGMTVDSTGDAEKALAQIGYYRLRGYCFQWYDNNTKKYQPGASFSDLLQLYTFDSKLSQLVFSFASQIEISLRARFIDAIIRFVDLKARIQKSNTFPRQVFVTRGSVLVFEFFYIFIGADQALRPST